MSGQFNLKMGHDNDAVWGGNWKTYFKILRILKTTVQTYIRYLFISLYYRSVLEVICKYPRQLLQVLWRPWKVKVVQGGLQIMQSPLLPLEVSKPRMLAYAF